MSDDVSPRQHANEVCEESDLGSWQRLAVAPQSKCKLQASMHQHHQTSSWLLGANWRMIFRPTLVWEHIIKALWLTWWNLKSSHLTMLLSSQAWPTKPRLLVGHLCQTQVHNRTEMEPEICQDQSKIWTSQHRLLMATIVVLVASQFFQQHCPPNALRWLRVDGKHFKLTTLRVLEQAQTDMK